MSEILQCGAAFSGAAFVAWPVSATDADIACPSVSSSAELSETVQRTPGSRFRDLEKAVRAESPGGRACGISPTQIRFGETKLQLIQHISALCLAT